MLGEGHLCVETEVEASAPVPVSRDPVAGLDPGARGVGEGAVVVARHCIWGSVCRWM